MARTSEPNSRPLTRSRAVVGSGNRCCGPLVSNLPYKPRAQRAFVVAKELRFSNGTQTVLAVLQKKTLSPDLEERLRREGLYWVRGDAVIVLNLHDRALEESLPVDGGLILDATRRAG